MKSVQLSRGRFVAGNAAALTGTGIVTAAAKAADYQFTCGTDYAATHPSSIRLEQLFADVEKESGGRVQTKVFPNSQLGGDSAMLSQLREGALTFYFITPGNLSPVVPAADITNLGMIFKDADDACRVHDGPVGAYVRDEIETKGIHALRTLWDVGMAQIDSKEKPIRTPADMTGFRMRVTQSKMLIGLFESLGANPVPLSQNELYTALQTKLVDGCGGPLGFFLVSKFYEVTKYISLINFSFGGQWIIANGEIWKKLPPDLQNIIERNGTKYGLLERNDTKALNTQAADDLKAKGLIFNTVDQTPFRTRLKSFYAFWSKSFSSKQWSLLEAALGHKLT